MFDTKNVYHNLVKRIAGWRKYIGLSVLVVFFSLFVTSFSSVNANAAPLPLPATNDAKIQKVMLTRFLGTCIKSAGAGYLSGGILFDAGKRITGDAPGRAAGGNSNTTDANGYSTPDGASDNYQDDMNR